MMSVIKNTDTAATLAYVERVLRYLASLRYFFDRLVRLLAFVSRAEGEENITIKFSGCEKSRGRFTIKSTINTSETLTKQKR